MIPYVILDRGMTPEQAAAIAKRIGPQSAQLERRALDYAQRLAVEPSR